MAYFDSQEGRKELAAAPRVFREDGGSRQMNVEDAISALIEEIGG